MESGETEMRSTNKGHKNLESRLIGRLRMGSSTMRDLHAATGRNYSSERIQGLMAEMCRRGEAFEEYVENGRGRPSIRYTLVAGKH